MKNRLAILALLLMGFSPALRASDPLEEYFYASGKIQVVIVVVSMILLGLLIYLFRLDKKITALENQVANRNKQVNK